MLKLNHLVASFFYEKGTILKLEIINRIEGSSLRKNKE